MVRTNAERQRAYRQRHLKDLDGAAERLSTFVSVNAKRALERMAHHHSTTQRAILERTLAEAERTLVDALPPDEKSAYYDGNDVTR